MDQFPELSFEAFAGLEHDSTRLLVLTVNNRHARRLVADLAAQMGDRPVRQMPRILPLSAWMRQAAESLVHAPQVDMASHVLDGFGAQQVWRQVIDEQEAQRPLLDTAQAARLAIEADRLLSDWQLQVPDGAETVEYQRFLDWRRAYHDRLAKLDAQDDNLLQEAVLQAARQDVLPLPFETVILVGFSELSPRVLTLLQHLQRQGRQVWLLRQAWASAQQAVRVACDDPDAQWRDAAAWAARQLRANPLGRFAIVAAQLESDMPFAHRVLRQALGADDAGSARGLTGSAAHAGDNEGSAVASRLAYNIAVARPLAEWPMVHAALAWLRALAVLARRPACDPQTLGAALLAGACAGETAEASGRAGIDAMWRRKAVLQVSRQDLHERLLADAPLLAQAWQAALAQGTQASGSAMLDAWAARFRQDLHALGFPGDAGQDSAAFQTLQALDEALDRFAGQAFAFGAVRRDEALAILDRLLRQSTFQPMRDPTARLDVLGMLEADGGHWDAVWVLGLNDEVLPAVPRPNPLLPLLVLRQAGTPRATPARELQWAQSMFDALLCCAPRIVFSHALRQGEQPLRPSPFVQSLPPLTLQDVLAGLLPVEQAPQPVRLETLLDVRGPALSGDRPMRGGIGVIDTQSRNPLWAFVKYRLGASLLPAYAEAADANTRGNFLHHGIELVWRMLPDLDALQQQIEQGTLETLIAQAVAQAAHEHLQGYGDTLRELEVQRAEGVLRDWLEAEGRRAPFAIRALEQSDTWRDGPLELRVRLDRIDVLPDGRLIVMDYKTGAGGIDPRNDWMRDRPVNLQLPFYAAMLEQEQGHVAALVLARLHARAVELRGLADGDDLGLPGVATPSDWPLFAQDRWADVMRHWRDAITLLARELADGEAANIVRRPSDLDYCDVLPFLRLGEEQIANEEMRDA